MEKKTNRVLSIAVIGGDKRIEYLAEILRAEEFHVIVCGTDVSAEQAVDLAEIIIGGIPFIKNGMINVSKGLPEWDMESFALARKKGQKIFAGVLPEGFIKECEKRGVICFDFMEDEQIAVSNTVATAEGAILEALQNKATNIHGSRTMVLGYGRCGKILCDKLKGLAAHVTVCCRNEIQMEYARAYGYAAFSLLELKERIGEFEYIYNTIPFLVLNKEILMHIAENALIIDIASGKGGVDFEASEALGIQALLCQGLPGKYAPEISAVKLADYVINRAMKESD